MEKDIDNMLALAEKRNAVQAAWYRQLLNLAAGGLALLVGLNPEVPSLGVGRYFLVAAWIFLGIGILCGASATYSEVSLARRLASEYEKTMIRMMKGEQVPKGVISANPHRFFARCKTAMVISLLLAVVSLVTYACIQTLEK